MSIPPFMPLPPPYGILIPPSYCFPSPPYNSSS